MAHILIVEDNESIREAAASYLRLEEFRVTEAGTLKEAEVVLRKASPDLMILDVMLPDGDGFQFAKLQRARHEIPIIFLTARVTESDRITGLELGADDYIVKPFSPKELVLRVKAVLRRAAPPAPESPSPAAWKHGRHTLSIDPAAHRVLADRREVPLTAAEWKIISYLAEHSGQVIGRDAILERCLDYEAAVSERTVDTHVKNLRAKLGEAGWIETARSFGYRFIGTPLDVAP